MRNKSSGETSFTVGIDCFICLAYTAHPFLVVSLPSIAFLPFLHYVWTIFDEPIFLNRHSVSLTYLGH